MMRFTVLSEPIIRLRATFLCPIPRKYHCHSHSQRRSLEYVIGTSTAGTDNGDLRASLVNPDARSKPCCRRVVAPREKKNCGGEEKKKLWLAEKKKRCGI